MKFTSRAVKYLWANIPIHFTTWPGVPKSFKDDHWERLTKNPGQNITRVDGWMAGYERRDGTVLGSAKEIYDKVKEDHLRITRQRANQDEVENNHDDLRNDALSEVWGPETKSRTQGLSSHISLRQYEQGAIARVLLEQERAESAQLKGDVPEIKSNLVTLMLLFSGLVAYYI